MLMDNCKVTTLKGTVVGNFPKYGEFKIPLKTSSSPVISFIVGWTEADTPISLNSSYLELEGNANFCASAASTTSVELSSYTKISGTLFWQVFVNVTDNANIIIKKKYSLVRLSVGARSTGTNDYQFNLADISYCTNLIRVNVPCASHGGSFGDLSEIVRVIPNLTGGLTFNGNPNISGDIAIFAQCPALVGYVTCADANIYGDLCEFNSEVSAFLTAGICTFSGTKRNDSNSHALAINAQFATIDDVNRFLIAQSNCCWGIASKRSATALAKQISIRVTGGGTVSDAAITAATLLRTNMYVNVGDATRTSGTYFTSIKVNEVQIGE